MGYLSQAIWWVGNLMLALILFRGWRGKLFVQFPYFYGYIGCVFCSTLLRLYLYSWTTDPYTYQVWYWISEAISVVFGFGVTWEIYVRILARYRGVSKMARTILGFLLTAVLAKAIVELWSDPARRLARTTVELEANMRVVQALLLLALLGLIVQYALPMGGNIRSMLLGYGFYVGCSAVTLSLSSRSGDSLGRFLNVSQRLAYLITLATWCTWMWSYSRDPAPDPAIECDYDRISEHTIRALGQLRDHLIHSWRA